MKRIYKIIVILCLLIGFIQSCFADSHRILSTYSEALNSLSKGGSVRAILFLDRCKSGPQGLNIAGLGFANFNVYQTDIESQKKNVIATSIDMLVEHSKLGVVHSYLRLRIFEDSSVEIFSEYLDPKSFSKLGSVVLNCHLSTENENYGVVLYELT